MNMVEEWDNVISDENEPPCRVDDEYWATAIGGYIEFHEMDDDYLKDTIKLCMRKRWPIPTLMLAELLNRKGLLE